MTYGNPLAVCHLFSIDINYVLSAGATWCIMPLLWLKSKHLLGCQIYAEVCYWYSVATYCYSLTCTTPITKTATTVIGPFAQTIYPPYPSISSGVIQIIFSLFCNPVISVKATDSTSYCISSNSNMINSVLVTVVHQFASVFCQQLYVITNVFEMPEQC